MGGLSVTISARYKSDTDIYRTRSRLADILLPAWAPATFDSMESLGKPDYNRKKLIMYQTLKKRGDPHMRQRMEKCCVGPNYKRNSQQPLDFPTSCVPEFLTCDEASNIPAPFFSSIYVVWQKIRMIQSYEQEFIIG